MKARVKTAEEILGVKGIKAFETTDGANYYPSFNQKRVLDVINTSVINHIYDFRDDSENGYKAEWLEFLPDDMPIDTKLIVWTDIAPRCKYKRYFAGKFLANGKEIGCWYNGKTSWSIGDSDPEDVVYWENWERTE